MKTDYYNRPKGCERTFLIIIALILLMITISLEAQEYKYCTVLPIRQTAGKMYCITVDSGQVMAGGMIKNMYKDQSGEGWIFNSPMDGINFMVKSGWDLSHIIWEQVGTLSGNTSYVMRRKLNK